jgi:hypothetical protein
MCSLHRTTNKYMLSVAKVRQESLRKHRLYISSNLITFLKPSEVDFTRNTFQLICDTTNRQYSGRFTK